MSRLIKRLAPNKGFSFLRTIYSDYYGKVVRIMTDLQKKALQENLSSLGELIRSMNYDFADMTMGRDKYSLEGLLCVVAEHQESFNAIEKKLSEMHLFISNI